MKEQSKIEVALLQTDIVWEEPKKNYQIIEKMIGELQGKPDLIVLPETFTTGFTMNVESNSDGNNETLLWLKAQSAIKDCVISGTVYIRERDSFMNRHYVVYPDDKVEYYDKRHLFGIGGEKRLFTPGRRRVVARIGNFRILIQTCYDLRFPVFSRYRGDYDAILYAANWPGGRQHVWETLLKARAIENQAFVIGINRAGVDGEKITYRGGSCVIDPKGFEIGGLKELAGAEVVQLNLKEVNDLRRNFPVYEDADEFILRDSENQ